MGLQFSVASFGHPQGNTESVFDLRDGDMVYLVSNRNKPLHFAFEEVGSACGGVDLSVITLGKDIGVENVDQGVNDGMGDRGDFDMLDQTHTGPAFLEQVGYLVSV